MNKYFRLLSVLVLVVASLMVPAKATSSDFSITEVELNGLKVYDVSDSTDLSYFGPVYAGELLALTIHYTGTGSADARFVVELADVEESTEYFTVNTNWTESKTLNLDLSDDLEPGSYVLHVEMEDESGNKEIWSNLEVEVVSQKNLVGIYDVNFPHGTNLQAGQVVLVSVGVRNMGHSSEEDVYVRMSVPSLGLSQRTNKFDLVTEAFANSAAADDDEYYKVYKDLMLSIPFNAPSGVYGLVLEVVYKNGDSEVQESYSLVVGTGETYDSEITMDATSQTSEQGKSVYFWLSYSGSPDYTVEVDGVNFGSFEVVKEDDGAYVLLSIEEDADLGMQDFTVTVKSGSNVLKTFDLSLEVTESKSLSSVKQGLELGFSILLVILVILGIIVAVKKLSGEEGDEPIIDEDQTYY